MVEWGTVQIRRFVCGIERKIHGADCGQSRPLSQKGSLGGLGQPVAQLPQEIIRLLHVSRMKGHQRSHGDIEEPYRLSA